MGSGISSVYLKRNGGSQEYASSYHVDKPMLEDDEKRGICHNGIYPKNPTAVRLVDKIHGNYIESKHYNVKVPYVITLDGNIIIGNRNGNGFKSNVSPTPHPTLIGGKDPQVKVAGILEIRGGKIYNYDNFSGHYKPNIRSMKEADKAFKKLPLSVFSQKARRNPNK
jgi:hypothetical protein